MREIPVALITDAVRKLYIEAACILPCDVTRALHKANEKEESPLGREILAQIIENAAIAERNRVPICQDTGMAVLFLRLGQDVHIRDGYLYDAINEGVRRAVDEGGLRASTVSPLLRRNSGDNTPAVIHTEIVEGDRLEIDLAPKGFGSENMSRLFMLTPSAGREGVIEAIVSSVHEAGGNPCPPVVVGVGIGGTAELAMLSAKKTLLRKIGSAAANERVADMEIEVLGRINALGVGPMGLGGRMTALAVHITETPTHIAGLPVAVNMQCHCARHASLVL